MKYLNIWCLKIGIGVTLLLFDKWNKGFIFFLKITFLRSIFREFRWLFLCLPTQNMSLKSINDCLSYCIWNVWEICENLKSLLSLSHSLLDSVILRRSFSFFTWGAREHCVRHTRESVCSTMMLSFFLERGWGGGEMMEVAVVSFVVIARGNILHFLYNHDHHPTLSIHRSDRPIPVKSFYSHFSHTSSQLLLPHKKSKKWENLFFLKKIDWRERDLENVDEQDDTSTSGSHTTTSIIDL